MEREKSLKKNYLYNLTYTVLNSLLPLATAPYLARIVGASGVGTYAYYYSIAHFFYIIAKLGLTNYGTREISYHRNDAAKLSEVFSSIYYQQLITTSLASFSYLIFCFAFLRGAENQQYAIILGIVVFAGFLDVDWLYSGLECFKQISRRNILVKLISMVFIFVFVKTSDDLWLYTLIMASGILFGYLSMWIQLKRIVSFKKVELSKVLKHLKPNIILVLPVFATSIYRSLDKVMLGTMANMTETGLFENAEKIIYTLCGFITALGTVMMPRVSNLIAQGKKAENSRYMVLTMQFMMCLMFAMSFGLLCVSDKLAIIVFGDHFRDSGPLIGLLAFTLPMIGWANVIRTQYIIPAGRDRVFVVTSFIGAICNIGVNLVFIPRLGAMGAVIGTLVAEGTVPIVQCFFLRKEIAYGLLIRKSCFAFIIGLLMFLLLKAVAYFSIFKPVWLLAIQMGIGTVSYVALTLIYLAIWEKATFGYLKRQLTATVHRLLR